MKLLKLTMQAFGSFATRTTVDFTDMQGLWLIAGDTGAGKTTIFDAIVYALFGESSGETRSGRQLRSDYADSATETFVELTFLQAGREWRAKRKPTYQRPKLRGEGDTTVPAACELTTDGESYTKERDMADKVRELLGVDARQFRQLAMIAQNDFRKILEASSKERQEMLRSMLGTERYRQFEQLLKNEARAAGDARIAAQRAVWMHAAGFRWDEASQQEETVARHMEAARARTDRMPADAAILAYMREQTARETAREAARHDQTACLEAAQTQAVEHLARAEQLNARFDRLHTLEAQVASDEAERTARAQQEALCRRQNEALLVRPCLEKRQSADEAAVQAANAAAGAAIACQQAEAAREAAVTAALQAPQLRAEAESLRTEADRLDGAIRLFDQLHTILDTMRDADADRRQKQQILAECDAASEQQEQALKLARELAAALPDRIREEGDCDQRRNELRQQAEAIRTLVGDTQTLGGEAEKLEKEKKSCAKKLSAYQTAEQLAGQTSKRYIAGQAAQLALRLEDDVPCPVCGSRSHPAPCPMTDEHVNAEEVEAARAAADEARTDYQQAKTRCDVAQSMYDEHQAAITRRMEELNIDGTVEDAQGHADEELAAAEEAYIKAEEARKAAHAASREADTLEEQLTSLRTRAEQARKAVGEAEIVCAGLRARVEQLRAQLPQEEEQEVRARLAHCRKRSALALQEAESLETTRTEAEKQIAALAAALHEKQEASTRAAAQSAEAAEALAERLNEHHFEDEAALLAVMPASEKALRDAEEAITIWKTNCAAHIASLSEIRTELADRTEADLDDLRARRLEAEETLRVWREESDRLHEIASANRTAFEGTARAMTEWERACEEDQFCTTLYAAASGNDESKLSFEVYVQRYYYERVVALANRRLEQMTGGMYRLDLGDAEGGRTKTGLDLIVLDDQTGKYRPVGTLSGGEKFKASLALALGMSDMVSAEVRSIDLGVLFIDEGFGTLDAVSLQQAMDVLIDIAHGSSKLVGVISHRPEMRERVGDHLIFVRKKKDGSVIERGAMPR